MYSFFCSYCSGIIFIVLLNLLVIAYDDDLHMLKVGRATVYLLPFWGKKILGSGRKDCESETKYFERNIPVTKIRGVPSLIINCTDKITCKHFSGAVT